MDAAYRTDPRRDEAAEDVARRARASVVARVAGGSRRVAGVAVALAALALVVTYPMEWHELRRADRSGVFCLPLGCNPGHCDPRAEPSYEPASMCNGVAHHGGSVVTFMVAPALAALGLLQAGRRASGKPRALAAAVLGVGGPAAAFWIAWETFLVHMFDRVGPASVAMRVYDGALVALALGALGCAVAFMVERLALWRAAR